MLDAKVIRSDPEKVRQALINRNADTSLLDDFLAADSDWRSGISDFEQMKNSQNMVTGEIAILKKQGGDASALLT